MEWITTSTVLHDLLDFDNRAAWDRFVSRFRRPIIGFARNVGLSGTDAEDVVQETLAAFAQSYRAGQYDRTRGRLSQWLFGIAYRKAIDSQRRAARNHLVGSPSDHVLNGAMIPDEQSAGVSWDLEWEQSLLEQCLEQVQREVDPVTYRAFDLVVREEREAANAAEMLGVNIKLVYNAKHRILKRIRDLRAELEQV